MIETRVAIEIVIVVIDVTEAIEVIGIAGAEEGGEIIVLDVIVLNVKHQAIVPNQGEETAEIDVAEKVVDESHPCIGMYLPQDLNI